MRRLTWVAPDGAVTSFGGAPVLAAPGVQFAGMPQVRASELTVPMQAGNRWQHVNHGPREVAIPVLIAGDTLAGNEAAVDGLAWLVDPTRGDGKLRATRHDGSERELSCRYVSSLQITEATAFDAAWQSMLVFRAVDPYWYDSSSQTVIVAPGPSPSFFPFFPLKLGASEASDSVSVVNDGQVEVWPVWSITGPGTFSASNDSLGEEWVLEHELGGGEIVTIDTRPGIKTVVSSSAGDLFGALTDTSNLWPLGVGSNQVTLTVSGADEESRLVLSWRRGWLSA